MTNVYYNPNGDPVFLSPGVSGKIRNQFAAVGLGFDGVAAALAALVQPTQPLTPININPDFLFDQVNEGGLYTLSGTQAHLMDGWRGGAVGAGAFKVRRIADPDNAALKCMELTCTTADATIGASDFAGIWSAVEGHDVAFAGFGTSQVKQLTLQFKFKTSVTGTYGVALTNAAVNRGYVATITVTDTNEHDYSITFTPDTTGAWDYTTGTGLRVHLTLAAGTDYHTTAGVWAVSGALTTSAQANFLSNTSNIAYLKRVHLVPGSVVLPYASTDVNAQLRKCQRYYVKTMPQGTPVVQGAGATGNTIPYVVPVSGVSAASFIWSYGVQMRGAGTVTFYNPGNSNANLRNLNDGVDSGAPSASFTNLGGTLVSFTQVAGDTAGDLLLVHATADARLT